MNLKTYKALTTLFCAIVLLLSCVSANGARLASAPESDSDVEAVVKDLCDKRVVILGEEANHGNGKTTQFKVHLIQRLVDECHYNAFYLEAGIYDFLNIQNKLSVGASITDDMIQGAISHMWASQEMAPLVPFLLKRVKSNAIMLGGIDDQIGASSYVKTQLLDELTPFLPEKGKSACRRELQKFISWQYSDSDPYSLKNVSFILNCIEKIDSSLSNSSEVKSILNKSRLQIVKNMKRFFTREKLKLASSAAGGSTKANLVEFNARDRSMFENFLWLNSQGAPKKVIIWAATIHAAKDLSSVKGHVTGLEPTTPISEIVPFGSYVHQTFGDLSFVLGFSALSGSYTIGVNPPAYAIPFVGNDYLEARVFANNRGDVRYLRRNQLTDLGPIAGHPINYTSMAARWDMVMDGLIVFREENPPHPVAD